VDARDGEPRITGEGALSKRAVAPVCMPLAPPSVVSHVFSTPFSRHIHLIPARSLASYSQPTLLGIFEKAGNIICQ